MAPSLPSSPSPPKRPAGNIDNDLTQSLKQLSLSTSSPARSPRAFKPTIDNPSSPRPNSVLRSPLNGPSSSNGLPSRSATPTLLRKASLNSLHSANGVAPQRRASSVNLMSPSARKKSPLRSLSPEPPERPVPTASSVASTYFKHELESHHGTNATVETDTLVILNDSCYGHRYSRPRTSRVALSTIVERPERIKASVLGVSAAYIRLGERHADGAYPPHPRLDPASLPSIPFRIQTTSRRLPLVSQTVTNVHGTKWMEELKIMCDSAETRLATNGKELQRPDISRGPDQAVPQKFHEGDLYLCAESLDALEGALGGVCEAVDAVFNDRGPRRAFVAIRPPGHHCSASYPSGFCWINNVHVGIMHAILSHGLTHAAIIDFDLHHGDGSQSVAWDHNSRSVGLSKNAAWWKKTSIGYFSIHDINSYPCEMGDEEKVKNASICVDNAHGQTIWNVHLQPWKTEAEFWKLYESRYILLLDKARSYLKTQTERLRSSGLNSKAAIFLSAGFDASEWEGAGMQRHNVNVPTEFYARFTRDVVRIAAEEGTSVEGRIVSVLEGGYSDRALFSGILSHMSGLAGDDPVVTKDQEYNGLGYEMGQKIGAVRGRKDSSASERGSRPYESSWWSLTELESLEALMAPPPSAEPKKPRRSMPPTYSSPTQSSAAKKVATPKIRRSASVLSLNNGSPLSVSRPPTPPPPEVPWTIAAHELSKLLIPSERQTDSCKHEDLSAEATRARRDRQAALSQSLPPDPLPATTAAPAPVRMSLRERRAKPSLPVAEEEEEKEQKNRRKTVAASGIGTERAASRAGAPIPRRQSSRPGRRLSAASTVVPDNAYRLMPPSTAANGFSRPETAQSIRPESSMSVRTSAGSSLAVKKMRTAKPATKDVIMCGSGMQRKSPPVSESPGTGPSSPATEPSETSNGQSAMAQSRQSMDSVDKLANDMKKIKITLVTKEQREARERERAEKAKAREQSSASAPEQKPVIKLEDPFPEQPLATQTPTLGSSTATSDFLGPEVQPNAQQFAAGPLTDPAIPAKQHIAVWSPPANSQQVPLPMSSPVNPSPVQYSQSSTPDMFIPYQPEGPAPEATHHQQQQQQPLQWLPPNTSTPLAVRRAELPVFTSTSAIPFAPRPHHESAATPAPDSGLPVKSDPLSIARSIWDVPETPQR